MQEEACIRANMILACRQSQFPTIYLGMPLIIRKPTRDLFMPLIKRFESKLEDWKSKLISRGGRLQLVNSVISSIPIYFMACFQLPKWVINRLDRIRRSFLWGKNEENKTGISLLNWGMVCLPKEWGGMRASNLRFRNISLLLRWCWRLYTNVTCLWSEKISS